MKLWKIMSSRIEFITRGVKIMAKRITRRSVTKATNKVNKTVNSPAARKRNPKPGSVTKSAKNIITTKKPTRKQVSQAVNKINQRGQAKLNALKNANAASKAKKVTSRKLPGRLGKIAAVGTALGAGALALMRKKDPTFGEAFKKARKEKGPNSTFNYKGKKYSTVTKDQIKKAGHSTLRSYLNAGGKKKTATKPKRRKTGPRNRR